MRPTAVVRRARAAALVASMLALAVPTEARAPVGDLSSPPIDTFTLANGLEVIVHEDDSAPVASVQVWYHVGSADDPVGREGAVRVVQELVATQTRSLAWGEQTRLIAATGGAAGAFTGREVTGFWERVPADRVNLALWIQASRMRGLAVDQTSLRAAVQAVEEAGQREASEPFSRAQAALDSLVAPHARYRHRVGGRRASREALSTQDVRAMYDRFFVPRNAVLTVVGDVDGESVRWMADEFFSAIPGGEGRLAPTAEIAATRRGGRRLVLDDTSGFGVLYVAFGIPAADHPDVPALTMLSWILSEGQSSRLHRRLVLDRAAPVVLSGLSTRRAGGMFVVGTVPGQGAPLERLERLIVEEVEALTARGPSELEMRRALNQIKADAVRNRLSAHARAERLQRSRYLHGEPLSLDRELERFVALTPDDLTRVGRRYLVAENRTVVLTPPGHSPSPGTLP